MISLNLDNNKYYTEEMKWDLFRQIVKAALEQSGYKKDADELADALDMSFDEIKGLPFSQWGYHILKDLQEMIADCPEDFS